MKNPLLIVIMLLAGFVLIVSIASLYAQSEILTGNACGCFFPIYMLIPLLSSAGLLMGSLIYFFLSSHAKKADFSPLLNLLDYEEKVVIEELVKNRGNMTQARLVSSTGINKVKVSRMLADLEQRNIVRKRAKGISNIIELEEKLKELLVG